MTALIVAAGSGTRMGGDIPKQYRLLGGKPVLRHAVEALKNHACVDVVQVVIAPGQETLASEALAGVHEPPFIIGGATRAESVCNGLASVEDGVVLVHDSARPFCPPQVVDRLLDALDSHDGAAPVLPLPDTLSRADGVLGEPIERAGAVRVQTPQAFRRQALVDAYEQWSGDSASDETTVARAAGLTIAAVEGDPALIKLTNQSDWDQAEALMAVGLVSRSGMGIDVHAFAGEGPIMLGGIAVDHPRGLAGHSDADVALHAITDALLGAAGLGDIGEHFPPSDPRWKGVSSDLFLERAASLIRSAGGHIDHIDCTIIAEEPKIGPHRMAIRSRIAAILAVDDTAVSVKATTTEGLGFTGRREGIAAQAVATIRLPNPV